MSWAGYDKLLGGIVDGQHIQWSAADIALVPATGSGGAVTGIPSSLSDLSDVDSALSPSTDDVLTYDGTEWTAAAPTGGGGGGGSGSLTELGQEVVGGGGSTTITFSSIPADHEDLLLVLSGRGTTSAQGVQVLAQFNNDTGSTYDWQRGVHFNGASSTGSESIAATSARFGFINAASATADTPGFLRVLIPAYARTTFDKTAIYECGYWNTNDPELAVEHGTAWWDDTSAITEIDLTCSAGDFAEGTVATLYGIGGTSSSSSLIALKDADETVNSSTTLQDDDDLTLSVTADTDYLLTALVLFNADATPDIKFGWSLPTGATMTWTAETGPGAGALRGVYSTLDETDENAIVSSGADAAYPITGLVRISSTAGSVTLQWAQDTSDAADTTVLADSWLKLERV